MSLAKFLLKDYKNLLVHFAGGHYKLPAQKCELQPNFLSCCLSDEPFYFINIRYEYLESIEYEARKGTEYVHHKIIIDAGKIK